MAKKRTQKRAENGLAKIIELPVDNRITGEERAFCLEYYRCGNGAASAKLVGYEGRRANKYASEMLMLPRIRAYIKSVAEVHEQYAEVHRQQFVDGIRMICATHIGDFMDDDWTKLKDMKDVSEEKLHAVKEVNVQEFFDHKGQHIKTNTTIKLVDKTKYMEMNAKINNYYEEHNNRKLQVEVKIG